MGCAASTEPTKNGENTPLSQRTSKSDAKKEYRWQAERLKWTPSSVDDLSYDIKEGDVKDIRLLGKGRYGQVFLAEWQGKRVAVKRLVHSSKISAERLELFQKEVALIKNLHHPNVVRFLGASAPPSMCIVSEFCALGDVNTLLRDKSVNWNDQLRLQVIRDLVAGVTYLHALDPPIVHRDLKPSNLLVSGEWVTKIGDFGLSRIKVDDVMTSCGTVSWTAPEQLRGEKYSEKADVYSFAIILWELYTQEVPYKGEASRPGASILLAAKIWDGYRPALPQNVGKNYQTLLTMCWDDKPENRPHFEVILAEWINKLRGEVSLPLLSREELGLDLIASFSRSTPTGGGTPLRSSSGSVPASPKQASGGVSPKAA